MSALEAIVHSGHVDGKPISRMLIDGGAIVHLMPYFIFKKSLATAFFVVEVQGNYSVILGCDWIHANRCIPSMM
jgi:hypothetical protein